MAVGPRLKKTYPCLVRYSYSTLRPRVSYILLTELSSHGYHTFFIGVAHITQYTHVRNKNSNTQESSPNVVKVIFHYLGNCSYRKEYAPSGSKFFPLREVPILKGA